MKTIQVNQKEIKIPKLGLKHHNMLKEVKSPEENLSLLINSIHPGLTPAEIDYGKKEDVDFMKMPAFVTKWADDISSTVAVSGPNGDIRGVAKIIGIFE